MPIKKQPEKLKQPAKAAPPPEPEEQAPGLDPKRKRAVIACGSCLGVFALALIIAIIALNSWDAKDGRLYKGKPIPKNVAYIGRWVSDDTVGACIATFAIAGDRIACDYAVRNDSKQDIKVAAIGKTIIAPPLDARLGQLVIEPELMAGDQPMRITDDENVLGLQLSFGDQWLMVDPGERASSAKRTEPFTLKPGELKRFRYRPKAHELLMPASALRICVALEDGSLHPFYFLRKSAGIGGWFERGAETAMTGGQGQ